MLTARRTDRQRRRPPTTASAARARWLLALPAHHVAGLQVLVRSVIAGTRPGRRSTRASTSPNCPLPWRRWAPGRRYASLVAVQLDKALADPAATAALAELDAVLIGGGPMPAARRAKALRRRAFRVVRTYGMSETAGGCVYDGVPLDGVRVRVDDGRIVLGGATAGQGLPQSGRSRSVRRTGLVPHR